MVNYNICWKDCPQRMFQKTDISSKHPETNSTRCTSHANKGTCEIYNCRALEQARRKQRIKAHNRRLRSSKASIRTRSQRRASKQARQELFGREIPRSNIARRDQESEDYFSLAGTVIESKTSHSSATIRGPPLIDSVDGACSTFKRIKARVTNKNVKPQASTRANSIQSRQLTGGPIDQVRRYQVIPGTSTPRSSRVYDSRTLYRKYNPSTRTGFASPARSKAFLAASTLASLYEEQTSNFRKNSIPETTWLGDPVKREISRGSTAFIGASRLASFAQGKSFSSSVHSIVQSIAPSPSSRSPSQRRALKHFTRELELYLQLAKQAPKQTPISSLPSTTFSTQTIQTIQNLKPYHAEFQAAGLAVTSIEQRNQSILGVQSYEHRNTISEAQPLPCESTSAGQLAESEIQRRRSLSDIEEPSQIILPDEMGIKGSNVLTKKAIPEHIKPEIKASATSVTSEETVIEWTPIYERNDPTNRLEPPQCCDLAPRVIQVSSPAKGYRPDSLISPKCSKSPTRKSLPWLRKPQTTVASSHQNHTVIQNNRLNKLAGDATVSPPYSDFTSKPNSQSSSIVLHLDTPPEHKRPILTQNPKTPASTASSATPVPNTTPYPQSYVGPVEGDNIGVSDFASLGQLPIQTRAALTNGDTIARKDIRLLKNHATQTSNTPSFITRAPHFTTQIPVTVQSQQRRGLILRSSAIGENQRQQSPQEAKAIGISEPAPPHQISRAASDIAPLHVPLSPLHCTQCNIDLNNVQEPNRPNIRSMQGPSIGFEPISKRRNICMCETPEAVHCVGCKLSMDNPDTSTKDLINRPYKQDVRKNVPLYEHNEPRATATGLEEKQKEPDVSVDEGYYTRQSDVRRSGGNATSGQISESSPDSMTKRSMAAQASPPQLNNTSTSRSTQATRLSQSTKPGYVQNQVLSYAKLPDIPILLDLNPKLSISESAGDLHSQLASLERHTRPDAETKKMFKGLRVATAAACEEGVDKFIEEITGYKVRKMLMDISALDGLGVNTLANVARQTAKKRRGDLRRLQMTRIVREGDREGNPERKFRVGTADGDEGEGEDKGGDGTWKNSLEEVARRREKERAKLPRSQSSERRKIQRSAEKLSRDRALGLVAGDQGVRLRVEAEAAFDEVSSRED